MYLPSTHHNYFQIQCKIAFCNFGKSQHPKVRWELNNWIFPFALKVEEESFTWTRLGERAGNWWNNGLQQQQYCSACNTEGGPWYIYGDCLWGGLGPVQGAWEPPSTLSASPIVVWRRSYRGLLNSSLDLRPNWKTNCGPHTYRAPVGSVPNILGKK